MKIRIYGDPVLRKKALVVKDVGASERMLIAAMIKTMQESKGIGLAAPQVGVSQQIIVVNVGEGPFVLVNPKIKKRRGSSMMEEGCLSLPGIIVDVKRAAEVWVEYLDEDNQPRLKHFLELLARVIQHETDHLNGKLIVDYAGWQEKRLIKKQLRELLKYGKVMTQPAVVERKESSSDDSNDAKS